MRGEKYNADVLLGDGDRLSEWGLDAAVLHTPGHTTGSISVLTAEGDLFCGDLLGNRGDQPSLWLTDDPVAAQASLERLKSLPIKMIYPGHGQPFTLAMLPTSAAP